MRCRCPAQFDGSVTPTRPAQSSTKNSAASAIVRSFQTYSLLSSVRSSSAKLFSTNSRPRARMRRWLVSRKVCRPPRGAGGCQSSKPRGYRTTSSNQTPVASCGAQSGGESLQINRGRPRDCFAGSRCCGDGLRQLCDIAPRRRLTWRPLRTSIVLIPVETLFGALECQYDGRGSWAN
jgi:hypothetical protein